MNLLTLVLILPLAGFIAALAIATTNIWGGLR
jgi:hypothetical protein